MRKIEDVFTPRRTDVNDSMYVERPLLERELKRALDGSQHVVLFGESGNGKSWLYKKVLGAGRYFSVNCADAARIGSISGQLISLAFPDGRMRKSEVVDEKSAGFSLNLFQGGLKSQNTYSIAPVDDLKPALKKLAEESDARPAVVVIENLESIFQRKDLMEELGNILLLLDDDSLAGAHLRFLIVGTPADVLEYFSRAENLSSVANRLAELPKVGGFSPAEVFTLLDKGFRKGLSVDLSDAELHALAKRIHLVTMGVAQRVHEYCLHFAYELESSDWKYEAMLTDGAENRWLIGGLRQCYTVVERCLNSRDAAVARRNQVVWEIGRVTGHDFTVSDIEKRIRSDFPDTVKTTNMGVGAILSELASGNDSLLVRNEKTGAYRARDPRYLMCIRVALARDAATKKIVRKKFNHG